MNDDDDEQELQREKQEDTKSDDIYRLARKKWLQTAQDRSDCYGLKKKISKLSPKLLL